MNAWTRGNQLARLSNAPRLVFAGHTTRLYRASENSKFHINNQCSHVRGGKRRFLHGTYASVVDIPESKACVCLPYGLPDGWLEILEPTQVVADLIKAVRTLKTSQKTSDKSGAANAHPGTLSDLVAAASLLTLEPKLAQARADIVASVTRAANSGPRGRGVMAEETLASRLEAANEWLDRVTADVAATANRARHLAATAQSVSLLASAAANQVSLDETYSPDDHPSLTVNGEADKYLLNRVTNALADALADAPADIADIAHADQAAIAAGSSGSSGSALAEFLDHARDAALAVVDDESPQEFSQLPNTPVPAGLTLRDAAAVMWRAAARAELATLVDHVLDRYVRDLTDRTPRVLVTTEPTGVVGGLLLGYESATLERDGERLWVHVVPSVVGRMVSMASGASAYVVDAPLPRDLEDAYTAGTARVDDVAGSVYATTLLRLMCDIHDPEDLYAAALGIAEAATTGTTEGTTEAPPANSARVAVETAAKSACYAA